MTKLFSIFFCYDLFLLFSGALTNHEYDFPPRETSEFDSSMPYNHYQMKRQEALLRTDEVFPIKIEDLHPDIT